jgi:putative transposase
MVFYRPDESQPKKFGRPRTDPRRILDALLYIAKGGIQWRLLLSDFPKWKTVYHVFRKWTLDQT